MKVSSLIACSLSLTLALPAVANAVDAQAVDACHQAIAKGMAAVSRGRIALVMRCLKNGNYDACAETDLHAQAHENELVNAVTSAGSDCQAAIDSGAAVSDFGPVSCGNEWEDCDTEVPSITTLDDLAQCLLCNERGFDFEIRHEVGLPRVEPTDSDENRCTRRIFRLAAYTIRKSSYDTAACAEGNTKPFACPVDPSENSRFGRSLATFTDSIAMCGIDEGKAPGALVAMCEGTATDAASLTSCFTGIAKCLACHTANSTLGQSDDCAAFSGFARCDGMF